MIREWVTDSPLEKGGIVLGMNIIEDKERVILNDDVNTLIIGSADSGKTRRILIPSVWEIAKTGESLVIADKKGELLTYSYGYLKKQGYNVIILNLNTLDQQKGNQFNLLEEAIKAHKDGNISKVNEIAWNIANVIVSQREIRYKNRKWIEAEKGTIAGLILLTVLNGDFKFQKHMKTVYTLLNEMKGIYEDEYIPLINYIESLAEDHPAKAAFKILINAPIRVKFYIMAITLADLELFNNEDIAELTSTQDHSIENISIEKTAVFLLFEDCRDSSTLLVNFYIDKVYNSLIELSKRNRENLSKRVNIIIDDLGLLAPFSNLDFKLQTAISNNIKFTLSIQNISQLKDIYKDMSKAIIDNCKHLIFLKTMDIQTAKFISNKIKNIDKNKRKTKLLYNTIDEILFSDNKESLVISDYKEALNYSLPDVSAWEANKELRFIKDSDIDKRLKLNRTEIIKRNNSVCVKGKEPLHIWIPWLDDII